MERGKISIRMESFETINYTFILKKQNIDNSPSVYVNFSPQNSPNPSPSSAPTLTPAHYLPTFNCDSSYFTPSFILRLEQNKYIENASSYLSLHLSKIQQLTIQKDQLFVPKPSKANSYCCICKTFFQDYLTHVTLPNHQQLMHGSDFNSSIDHLCRVFTKEDVGSGGTKNKKKSRKINKAFPKRKQTKNMNLISMPTSTTLSYQAQPIKQITV